MRLRHVLLAATLLGSVLPAQACRMTMALEQWPPYLYRDAQGRYTGLDLELLRAIFKEARCTLLTVPELPTARRQLLFQTGGLDLMLAASETPERQSYARFSISYRDEAVGVFGKAGTPAAQRHIASFAQLARGKATLLAPKVGWYGAEYAAARAAMEKDGRLNTFGSFQQGLRMLDAGRADLLLGDVLAVRHEARLQGVALTALPFLALRAPVHLMLNARTTSADDLARLDTAIARLEQRGALAAIRARYDAP
ncbi:transporter substrate-binding domain-containing protein [Janthinobacterium sp. GW460P]|uniref:substrate-binding periplasmic protein n=1 Tax=unclassified Janthinobacterium TaxID=2610881 RepID=UPI000A321F10|nr:MULTISPECIES: transporter substrate-binding domain-containing protein [unclassified Janthinobacterium]MCC7704255.1 transporter substrate-binding domain-containing protein [Janthinobacterium sp. GW460P]MCC7709693.1 transporter substrate-binding domain-containing protein [Janthinobacterium sp. GW460W]